MSELFVDDLDNAPCGFLTYSDTGIIISVNATLLEILGYTYKEELTGSSIEALFTVAGRIFYQTHFYPMLKLHHRVREIFFSLKCKNRGTVPVICNAVQRTRDGIVSNHCIVMPVTERGKYEQELLAARRTAEEALEKNEALTAAKKELEAHSMELDRQISTLKQINDDLALFSKMISHDLQEPIRKIALMAEKVKAEAEGLISADGAAGLEKINRACRKLRSLAGNMERFISLNIHEEDIATLDLNKIVNNAYEQATMQGCTDLVFTADALPSVSGYPEQMGMLFYYLFDNCIKFRQPNRPLLINIGCNIVQQNSYRAIKGKYRYIDFVKIELSDNGQGFDERNKEVVFQLQKKSGHDDIGFGLAFCRKIVDIHYGNIYADSVIGKGTTITILLPANS